VLATVGSLISGPACTSNHGMALKGTFPCLVRRQTRLMVEASSSQPIITNNEESWGLAHQRIWREFRPHRDASHIPFLLAQSSMFPRGPSFSITTAAHLAASSTCGSCFESFKNINMGRIDTTSAAGRTQLPPLPQVQSGG